MSGLGEGGLADLCGSMIGSLLGETNSVTESGFEDVPIGLHPDRPNTVVLDMRDVLGADTLLSDDDKDERASEPAELSPEEARAAYDSEARTVIASAWPT